VNNYRLEFQYNLGNLGDKELTLHFVNASNGEWHTVYMERYGKAVTLKMDVGEGRFYNHTSGDTHGHQITRLEGTVLGGADYYKDSKYLFNPISAIVKYAVRPSFGNLFAIVTYAASMFWHFICLF
jgi:hypothetical protein